MKRLPESLLWRLVIVFVHGQLSAMNVQIADGVLVAFPVVFQVRTVNIVAFAEERKATVPNVADTKPLQLRFT